MRGDPLKFPKIKKRIAYRNVTLTAVLITKNNSFLLIQRPSKGVLREMWEFPMIEGDVDALEAAYSLHLAKAQRLKPVRHNIMDQRITIMPWLINSPRSLPQFRNSCWLNPAEIKHLPTSSMVFKILRNLP